MQGLYEHLLVPSQSNLRYPAFHILVAPDSDMTGAPVPQFFL